jgi:hypothetical protein
MDLIDFEAGWKKICKSGKNIRQRCQQITQMASVTVPKLHQSQKAIKNIEKIML